MDAYMNKGGGKLKINKLQNPQCNTQRTKNLSIRHKIRSVFFLILYPPRPQMNCQKRCQMTHMIQVQGKNQPNLCYHLRNNPHFRLNKGLIIKKHP